MKRLFLLVLLLLVSTIVACSSVRVSQDYDLAKPLPVLETYRWKETIQPKVGDARIDNPLLDARIRNSIDQVLESKGLEKVTDGISDCMVAYRYSITRKISTDDLHTGFGVGGYGRHGGMVITSGPSIKQYDQAYLIIDLTAGKDGTLFWRGNGTRYLPEHMSPEKAEAIFHELVAKILVQFPPFK